MRTDVVALYVDPRGPYPKLVEQWYDEKRDARTYSGPLPIVAHPPCGPWSSLAHLHTRPEEKELGFDAVRKVRMFGGVLEQPKGSKLFVAAGIPTPKDAVQVLPDGFTVEVEQVRWGHVARKRTWLWCVGIEPSLVLANHPPPRDPTHWVSGFRSSTSRSPKHYKKNGCAVPPGIKVCSAQQRRRTPIAFAEWLLELASSARV